ncbi:DUF4256 domain-containing protein [Patescibacteria group bacterium]|nr:DUF4256 domain-containing protein [Patescibacteria group bacterium]
MTKIVQQGIDDATEVADTQTVTPDVQLAVTRAASEDLTSSVEVDPTLEKNRGQVFAVVARILAKAGVNVQFIQPQESSDESVVDVVVEAQAQTELAPELEAFLGTLHERFDALPHLHQGVEWAVVESSLKADLESMRKLLELDKKGHEMNVFGEKNGEIQFRSAQLDVLNIAPEHRTIMCDKKARTDFPEYNVDGSAEEIAKSMGVELADPELYEQLRVKNGWVWLKTDAATRKSGYAFGGYVGGICKSAAGDHSVSGSFCAALRVKKA